MKVFSNIFMVIFGMAFLDGKSLESQSRLGGYQLIRVLERNH